MQEEKAKKKALPYLKTVSKVSVDAISKDGELYTAEKRIQVVIEEDQKFLLMSNYIFGLINGIDSIVDMKIMSWIQENLAFNSNIITLSLFWKEKIKEQTGYSISAIERSIGVLVKKEFLLKDETCKRCAIYTVNPTYVWYGDREARKGKLKFTLEVKQFENLPDREKEIEKDIQRALDNRKKNK